MSFFTRVIFVAVALGMVASGLPVHHKHKHTDVDTVDATVPTSVFSLPSSATGDAVGFAPTPILSASKGVADVVCPGCGLNRDNQTFTV